METIRDNSRVRELNRKILAQGLEEIKKYGRVLQDCPEIIFERQFDNGERYPDMDLVDPYGED